MQIHIEEFARLTALLSPEEREETAPHSHLCRCMSCHKMNIYLILKEHVEKWEKYRTGDGNETRKHYEDFKRLERQVKEQEEIDAEDFVPFDIS